MAASPPLETTLTRRHLLEVEMVFDMFDVEGTRLIPSDHLETMLRLLGFDSDWKELRYLQSKLRGLDVMELNQFMKIVSEAEERCEGKRGHSMEEIMSIFQKCWDPEATGFIDTKEFVHAMKTHGDPLNEKELEAMLTILLPPSEEEYEDTESCDDMETCEEDTEKIDYEFFTSVIFESAEYHHNNFERDLEKYYQERKKKQKEEEEKKRREEEDNTE